MQTGPVAELPLHPTLTLHGRPVRALGWSTSGRLIWPVHGGADADPDEKRFTQAHLDRVTAEARSRGERAGRQQGIREAWAQFLEQAGLPLDTTPEAVSGMLARTVGQRVLRDWEQPAQRAS